MFTPPRRRNLAPAIIALSLALPASLITAQPVSVGSGFGADDLALINQFAIAADSKANPERIPSHFLFRAMLDELRTSPSLLAEIAEDDLQIIDTLFAPDANTALAYNLDTLCSPIATANADELLRLAVAAEAYRDFRNEELNGQYMRSLSALSEEARVFLNEQWQEFFAGRRVLYRGLDISGLARVASEVARVVLQENCHALGDQDMTATPFASTFGTVEVVTASFANALNGTGAPAPMNTLDACGIQDSSDCEMRAASSALEERDKVRVISTVAMIQGVEGETLIVRSDTGHYFTLSLPSRIPLTRHTDVNLSEIKSGDDIGLLWGFADDARKEIREFRVYRTGAVLESNPGLTGVEPLPGFEVRGRLKALNRIASGGNVQLSRGNVDVEFPVAREVVVTLIEAATQSDLKPFSGRVRVLAEIQPDGSLLTRQLVILK